MIDPARPDLVLVVRGHPATAGNKTGFPVIRSWRTSKTGERVPVLGVRMVESGKSPAAKLKVDNWRADVGAAVLQQVLGRRPRPTPLDGPLFAWADFYLQRPKTVKAAWPTVKPDWSKLLRALEDPVVRPSKDYPGLIADDARIVFGMGGKFYAEAGAGPSGPRAELRVWRIGVNPEIWREAIAAALTWLGTEEAALEVQGALL